MMEIYPLEFFFPDGGGGDMVQTATENSTW